MSTKLTKALVAALIVAATSLTFVADASAGPRQGNGWSSQGGGNYMNDRHDPTNTNGGA
jgi:Spy/CpxP family protein refolding chaperone